MRYRYVTVVAILVMFLGVVGIFSHVDSTNDADANVGESLVYQKIYVANDDIVAGTIVDESFFIEQSVVITGDSVDGEDASPLLTEAEFGRIMFDGAFSSTDIQKNSRISVDMLKNIKTHMETELIALPISVSAESLNNPTIEDYGFVDLFLISNDTKVFQEDVYSKSRDSMGLSSNNYKSTRVKKFASNVWIEKKNHKKNIVKQTSKVAGLLGGSDNSDSSDNQKSGLTGKKEFDIVYAYFSREDLDKVIQAQVLGSFVLSPVKINFLNSPLASLNLNSREITPSDVVIGAPMAETQSKILEIRGAKRANVYN